MKQELCRIRGLRQVAENTFVLTFTSAHLCSTIKAGQFVNIKVDSTNEPLLRRPYSVYHTERDSVDILFNVVGKGSVGLRRRSEGESLDVLGPLGVPFTFDAADYETAILVGGGLGVAPFPLATRELTRMGKPVVTLLGARTANQVVDTYLQNVHVATEDGSRGTHGNVVDLARQFLESNTPPGPKLFACGPRAMLRALGTFAIEHDIPCEVSLEGPMACGFGVCQGCPVELAGTEKKYALMCKDGPTFDVRTIKL